MVSHIFYYFQLCLTAVHFLCVCRTDSTPCVQLSLADIQDSGISSILRSPTYLRLHFDDFMRRFLSLPYRDSCPMPGFIDFPLSQEISVAFLYLRERFHNTFIVDQCCQVLLPAGTGMWPFLELIYISFNVLLLFRNKLIPYLGLLFSQVAGFTRWGLALRYYSLYSIFPYFFHHKPWLHH